jgi:hypothetical protein
LWTALRDKHFPPWTGNISLWISFVFSPFAHKSTMFFGSMCIFLKHSRHFDYRN